jgi:Ca2+-transporting ATPase
MMYDEYAQFFRLSPDDLNLIVEGRNIRCGGRVSNLDELARLLYRNLLSGSVETSNEHLLHKEYKEVFNKDPPKNIILTFKEYSTFFYGKNEIREAKRRSFWEILVLNARDKTLLLLVIASILSLSIGVYKMVKEDDAYAWIEGTSILFVVILIITIGALNMYSQESLYDKLGKKNIATARVKVFDNYSLDTKDIKDLLVGDVVYLEPGDVIPGDSIMLGEDPVVCDESMVSGESEPAEKGLSDPFLISGAYLTEGATKALVLSTGKNSIRGKIIQNMNKTRKKTPLEHKVEKLSESFAQSAFYISITLLFCHLLRITIFNMKYNIDTLTDVIIESISIAVMAVPEGLPMAIALALSFGTKRMLKDNNLVKDVSACETMNNANYICTDKTGTLTPNKMSITAMFAGGSVLKIRRKPFSSSTKYMSTTI